jgi:Tfp pilus assembly protein PilN
MRAVNLLTPEMRSSQKGSSSSAPRPAAMTTPGGIGAIALLGALALIVAGVAGVVLSNNVVKQKQTDLAAVRAKNDATVKRAQQLKPYADFQSLAQARASTVQGLASARFDWEQSLRDLSRALPKDVYLSSLDGTVGGGAAGGSGIRSSISSPAIELAGCTKTQPGVARLMSRLRNVQGVTRVSLSKSEKSDTAAANGGSSTTGGSTVGPCGKGSPPSFEIVVFFEKAAVADALASATGDTSATGTASTATAVQAANATGKGTDDSAAKASSTPAATPGG